MINADNNKLTTTVQLAQHCVFLYSLYFVRGVFRCFSVERQERRHYAFAGRDLYLGTL